MRYDAAIIGAGANGLAAAAVLAGAGLKTILLERGDAVGGRCRTREFHPGFRASAYCDALAPIPAEIFRALDLARHGAIVQGGSKPDAEIVARAFADASAAPSRGWFASVPEPPRWPGGTLARRSLAEVLDETLSTAAERSQAMARAIGSRAVDPFLPGSALLLLTGASGAVMGGLGALGGALESKARASGAEIALGLEVADIRHSKHRASGVHLADGTEIEARGVISTLDLRRTFFSLFAWKDLPKPVVERVTAYRQAASAARLLIALDAVPQRAVPAHIAPSAQRFAEAAAAWRSGTVPERPPIGLNLVSAADPRLAPVGKASLTASIGSIPHHLFDGAWTNEKRNQLRERVLAEIATVLPDLEILASELIVPPDIEAELGLSEGDLDGGELAPDQMFAARGFADHPGGRTPVAGLYLGGHASPLGPFASCAPGIAAAHALMADLR